MSVLAKEFLKKLASANAISEANVLLMLPKDIAELITVYNKLIKAVVESHLELIDKIEKSNEDQSSLLS